MSFVPSETQKNARKKGVRGGVPLVQKGVFLGFGVWGFGGFQGFGVFKGFRGIGCFGGYYTFG